MATDTLQVAFFSYSLTPHPYICRKQRKCLVQSSNDHLAAWDWFLAREKTPKESLLKARKSSALPATAGHFYMAPDPYPPYASGPFGGFAPPIYAAPPSGFHFVPQLQGPVMAPMVPHAAPLVPISPHAPLMDGFMVPAPTCWSAPPRMEIWAPKVRPRTCIRSDCSQQVLGCRV